MIDKASVAEMVRQAFARTPYPGDPFLVGSHDGCEPADEVGPFAGQTDWSRLQPEFLDARYCALSFFSEGALRFFLPAYLLADLDDRLDTADPVFHLTHGFIDIATDRDLNGRRHTLQSGKSALVNPRRYGAMTFYDYARFRLSVFAREETQAIVAYLEYKREASPTRTAREAIDAALESFWRDRAQAAPSADALELHVAEQQADAASRRKHDGRGSLTKP